MLRILPECKAEVLLLGAQVLDSVEILGEHTEGSKVIVRSSLATMKSWGLQVAWPLFSAILFLHDEALKLASRSEGSELDMSIDNKDG